jgi:hypothetical protein
VIAIQRYLKICRPFGVQMTIFWKRLALCSCIISAIVFAIPLLLYNDEIKVINPVNNVTGYVCDIDVKRPRKLTGFKFMANSSDDRNTQAIRSNTAKYGMKYRSSLFLFIRKL